MQKTGGSAGDVEGWQFEGAQRPLFVQEAPKDFTKFGELEALRCATPITLLWRGLTLVKVRKSALSFVTEILAPESQMIGKDPSLVIMLRSRIGA